MDLRFKFFFVNNLSKIKILISEFLSLIVYRNRCDNRELIFVKRVGKFKTHLRTPDTSGRNSSTSETKTEKGSSINCNSSPKQRNS
jgi:hypothetical protein